MTRKSSGSLRRRGASPAPEIVGTQIALDRCATDKPYLGDPAIIEELMRALMLDWSDRVYAVGIIGDLWTFKARVAASNKVASRALARILTGADPANASIRPVSDRAALARHLAHELGIDPGQTDEDIVATAFMMLFDGIEALMDADADGRLHGGMRAGRKKLVHDFTRLLQGLPWPTGKE